VLGTTEAIERSVQALFEKNLEALLGVRFLTSEFTTTHGGRIDTLGLDENGSPVILEYKRATNENVINQGLFYIFRENSDLCEGRSLGGHFRSRFHARCVRGGALRYRRSRNYVIKA